MIPAIPPTVLAPSRGYGYIGFSRQHAGRELADQVSYPAVPRAHLPFPKHPSFHSFI